MELYRKHRITCALVALNESRNERVIKPLLCMASSTTRCCPYVPYSARLGGDHSFSGLFRTFFARKSSHYLIELLESTNVSPGKVYYMHELKSGPELARTLLLSLVDRELNPSGTDHSREILWHLFQARPLDHWSLSRCPHALMGPQRSVGSMPLWRTT
jgi:hypothetical protein